MRREGTWLSTNTCLKCLVGVWHCGFFSVFIFIADVSVSFHDKIMSATEVAFPFSCCCKPKYVPQLTVTHTKRADQVRFLFSSNMRKVTSRLYQSSGWLLAARHAPAQVNRPLLNKSPRDRKTCQFLPIHERSPFRVVPLRAVTGSDTRGI